jgi:hypothetical protein
VLGALGLAAAALIAVELARGALSLGEPELADPCTSKPAFSGGGLDGAVQRFALEGLNGAACELHTTREELVLSFVPSARVKEVRWDRPTIERALRAGCGRGRRRERRRWPAAEVRAREDRLAVARLVPRNGDLAGAGSLRSPTVRSGHVTGRPSCLAAWVAPTVAIRRS